MKNQLSSIRFGLIISMLTLFFGLGMGMLFGMKEDAVKNWIDEGIAQHSSLHDSKSPAKIWRYAQRAHFHAMGIGAATIALILVVGYSDLRRKLKTITAILIGLGGLYPLAWFSMFLLGPSMGREAAHHAFITEFWTHLGVGSLFVGMLILFSHILFGIGQENSE
ncbi:MAG: hypothetical protein HQL67_00555 [Magnetococcales bacterium]|nr:hypothetical protein [Magnetococcales bacterium]